MSPCEYRRLTFPATSEEHANDEDLQASHADHQTTLHQAEIEYSLFGASDCAEVSVLTRAEVLLLASERRHLSRQTDESLLYTTELFWAGTTLLREVCSRLILNLTHSACVHVESSHTYRNLKVNELVGEGGNTVVEAESVLSNSVRCEYKVALLLLLTIEDQDLFSWLCR